MRKIFLCSGILVFTMMASGSVFSEVKNQMKSSENSSKVDIRKLTLTLGQSAHSVKMNPALNDQIDEDAFIKGIAAYMNQPFDFTYQQDSFSLNVPRTHTLSLFATESKLSDISIELYPLFQDDFDGAFTVLEKWEIFFQQTGMEKQIKDSYVILPLLKDKFKNISQVRCGFNTGSWLKNDTKFSIGIDRFEREIYDLDTKQMLIKPVYKVSINIRSINHGIGSH